MLLNLKEGKVKECQKFPLPILIFFRSNISEPWDVSIGGQVEDSADHVHYTGSVCTAQTSSWLLSRYSCTCHVLINVLLLVHESQFILKTSTYMYIYMYIYMQLHYLKFDIALFAPWPCSKLHILWLSRFVRKGQLGQIKFCELCLAPHDYMSRLYSI